MDIETGVTEEQGDLIRGSFLEGILSGDALPPTKSADLVPTAFTDPAPPIPIIWYFNPTQYFCSTTSITIIAKDLSPFSRFRNILPTPREVSLNLSNPCTPLPPPGYSTPAILQIPETMSSQMTEFDCQGSPIRHHPGSPSLLSHTSLPLTLLWRRVADKAGAARGDWGRAKTLPVIRGGNGDKCESSHGQCRGDQHHGGGVQYNHL